MVTEAKTYEASVKSKVELQKVEQRKKTMPRHATIKVRVLVRSKSNSICDL